MKIRRASFRATLSVRAGSVPADGRSDGVGFIFRTNLLDIVGLPTETGNSSDSDLLVVCADASRGLQMVSWMESFAKDVPVR